MSTIVKKSYQEMANKKLPDIMKKHFGEDTELLSWHRYNFLETGENYLGRIIALVCNTYQAGVQTDILLIAKINPRRALELFQRMTQSFFIKEGRFFMEIAPELNSILKAAQFSPLKIPKCLFVDLTANDEVVLLQDLRRKGFKCANRLIPLDMNHLLLSLEELAKLHASSHIFISKQSEEQLQDLSYMNDLWLHAENHGAQQYINYCSSRFYGIIHALKEIDGFEKVQTWLEKKGDKNLFAQFVNLWESTTPQFRVICHGDVWINNMMFRYKENGACDQVILIDFQQCRIASLITDLYIFLITSAHGTTRRTKLKFLLQSYYNTFQSVFSNMGKEVPFTFEELLEEWHSKMPFGFLCGIIRLPLLLAESNDEVYDFNSLNEKNFATFLDFQKRLMSKVINGNVDRSQRLLSIFDAGLHDNYFG